MSPRSRPYAAALASLPELRYAVPDALCDASISSREPADLVFRLFGAGQTGATQVRFWGDPIFGIGSCGKVGFAGRFLQRVVADCSSDGAIRIGRTLVGRGAIVEGRTCIHVSDRRDQVGRASSGARFRKGRIWKHQRHCGGQVGAC